MTELQPAAGFFSRWWAFFRPLRHWKERYQLYLGGQKVWMVPGKPESPSLVPWPLEWIPARLEVTEADSETAQTLGFVLQGAICTDSGKSAQIGQAVRCCRCGVPLHQSHAHMLTSISPPSCSRCTSLVKLLKVWF